jgi:predicted RNase H-like HicB family nuclease
MKAFKVYAQLDEESQVWYVHKSDIPGLHAEADSPDELLKEILELIPMLIAANGIHVEDGDQPHKQVPIELIAQRRGYAELAC